MSKARSGKGQIRKEEEGGIWVEGNREDGKEGG